MNDTNPQRVSSFSAVLYGLAAVLSLAVGFARAEPGADAALKLAAPFSDGAVLQRQVPVPVWGWGKPGDTITVTFAGQSKTATVNDGGKWRVDLDPLEASFDSRELTVADGSGSKQTVKDVLVGEVWMASGQSNMQWEASKADVGRVLQQQVAERVAAGKEPQPVIREGKITDVFSAIHPVEHATMKWSTEISTFSAISYAFAYELARELKVPIGILNCSFSTTSIQAWTPRVGFRDGQDEYTKNQYLRTLQTDPTTPEFKQAWDAFYAEIEQTLAENQKRLAAGEPAKPIPTQPPGNLNGNRDASWMYNARIHPVVPYAIRGCIWNQGYASANEGIVYYNNLHSLIRGWRIAWDRPNLPVYFHQFYTASAGENSPNLDGTSQMRLGTWLARDIPHTGMASQIDIGGGIHYFNKALPGKRLALHALKNQYPDTTLTTGGKAGDLVADGPMFKSYAVEGNKLIVQFENADGGLVVGETATNAKENMAVPTVIPDGQDKVQLFYIADQNRVWHPASMQIDGDKVILTAPGVDAPHGVSYASRGVSSQPNLYNKALLPATPFMYYDHKLITTETWPEEPMKIAGVEPDLSKVGLLEEYRKLPILSTQFRDNAVLQAGVPVTIWGATALPWGEGPQGDAVIHFSFGDVKKDIPVAPGAREWSYTLEPMKPSAEPKTLKVSFTINGELAHERVAENIVVGDVWYVAAPDWAAEIKTEPVKGVRALVNNAKRWRAGSPSRFSVSVSTTPDNRFAAEWEPASGFAAEFGKRIAEKTGQPVGIIFMQVKAGKEEPNPPLKLWMSPDSLRNAPSLADDYNQLASLLPGTPQYNQNVQRYVEAWKKYWSEYVPVLMKTGAVPDARPWGSYPSFAGGMTTQAAQAYNVMVHSLTPASFKGVVFFTSAEMVADDQAEHFAEQLTALANGWKTLFGAEDTRFYAVVPSQKLAPKAAAPTGIQGYSKAITVEQWPGTKEAGGAVLESVIDQIVKDVYQ